ncbi:nucleotidyltransferase domain-containing protein [Paradevosia shaoguanensis]|uniref:nucleotidyltransferase domain-containing protein n=1 Tax=Paradevosia shaoguanensis TaxID=1335043 RepID=UPI003C714164
MVAEHEKPWSPLAPAEVATLLHDAPFPWWIAGGYAIDHFVGRTTRPHGDIDVLLLHHDHEELRKLMAGRDCWVADPPGRLRPWPLGENLAPQIHDIWCRPNPDAPWAIQFMLDDGTAGHWQSRRNAAITRPLAELGARSETGIPYLTAEIQLFYKAKSPRPKDLLDFEAALPLLADDQREWLAKAITLAYGEGHDWLKKL